MNKKFGLGKGLEALIPEGNEDDVNSIDINFIKAHENQPRKSFDKQKIMELAESIKEHGIIQPLILKRISNSCYKIIAGERRWRAAKLAGIKNVPAIIMDLTDKDILEVSLIENIQREDLNPIEEALGYKRLIEDFKLTQDDLAKKIGKSRAAIANNLRLLNLDKRVQEYLAEDEISEGHGRVLLELSDKEKQYRVALAIIDKKLSVRETERLVKLIKNKAENKENLKEKQVNNNPYINEVKMQLENHFKTKINIVSKKNKGKIEIEYYSNDDLQRIIELLNIKL